MKGNKDKLSRQVERLTYVNQKLKKIRTIQSGLLQLSELASKVHDLTEFFPQLNHVVSNTFNSNNNFYVALENEIGELELVYFVDEKDDSTVPATEGLDEGLTGYVYKSSKTLLCDKQKYFDLVAEGTVKAKGTPCELWLGVPLIVAGKTIGVMATQSYDKAALVTEQTLAFFENLGMHLMTAINRVKRRELLESEVKERTKDLQRTNRILAKEIKHREYSEKLQKLLFTITEMGASSAKISDFYVNLQRELSQFMNMDNCYIALVDEDKLKFPFYVDKHIKVPKPRKLSRGFTEYVIRQGESLLIDKAEADLLEQAGEIVRSSDPSQHSSSWLGAPLRIDDKILGVISVQSYERKYDYTEKDLMLLNFVSFQIAVAIQRQQAKSELEESYRALESKVDERTKELKQTNAYLRTQVTERQKAEQKLFYQANHDSLTDLPNRAMFRSKLEQVLNHTKRHTEHFFALMFIDLDKFKQVNDNLGHKVGDEFLVEVSRRILACVRNNDMVARVGGDEFVVLLDSLPDQEFAEEVARRIIDVISQPLDLVVSKVNSGASIGIAFCDPEVHEDIDDIVKDADLAMYKAKAAGRGQYIVFDKSLRDSIKEQELLADELNNAPKRNNLSIDFNPIMSKDAETVSCLYAAPFVHLSHIGKVALADVEFQADETQVDFDAEFLKLLTDNQHKIPDNQTILLPVSAEHLTHIKKVDALIKMVKQTLPTSMQIALVFMERDLVALPEYELKHIKQIKKAGIPVALGQYGEKHASLSLLTRVHFDFVLFAPKLVKSMSSNPSQAELLKTTIAFVVAQKSRPIVMGIDLEQHLSRSDEVNVDLIMGQYVGRQLVPKLKAVENAPSLIQHSA